MFNSDLLKFLSSFWDSQNIFRWFQNLLLTLAGGLCKDHLVWKIFDLNVLWKNDIKDENKKLCSRFRDTVSNKVNFTSHSHQRDHPPTWELKHFENRSLKITLCLCQEFNSHAVGKIGLRKWFFFGIKEFFINFDLKNGCKNEFQDNDEKSSSWSRNRVSKKFDF